MMKDWVNGTIDQLCEVEYGTRVVRKRDAGSKYPTYGGGGATFFMDTHNRQDRMVIARFAISEQCTRFVEGKFFLNDSGLTINPKEKENVDSKFLNYQILSLNDEIYSLGRGTAQKNLNMDEFKKLNFSYPQNLSEQKRIVAKLDECFEAINTARANVEKNLNNAKELFQSQLNQFFSQKGEGWVEKKLGDIASFRNGLNFTKNSDGENIKIVGVKDFQQNYWIPFDELDEVIIDGVLSQIDYLEKNDIITVRSNGNPNLIGRCILASEVHDKTSHSGFTIRIRLESEDLFSSFLCYYLKSQKARKELVESGTGVNIKSLNQQTLSSIYVTYPNLFEQKSLVQKIDRLKSQTQSLESNYQQELDALDELKKSILQKAFNGEL